MDLAVIFFVGLNEDGRKKEKNLKESSVPTMYIQSLQGCSAIMSDLSKVTFY